MYDYSSHNDRAVKIAVDGMRAQHSLDYAAQGVKTAQEQHHQPVSSPEPSAPDPGSNGLLGVLVAIVIAILAGLLSAFSGTASGSQQEDGRDDTSAR